MNVQSNGFGPIDARVRIGHVHLKVADLRRSLAFYCGVLGLELKQRFDDSAAFLAAGDYHHHIALNTWESLGGGAPAEAGRPELLTLGSNGAIKQGLAVGLGVTLISRLAVAGELADGTLREIAVPGTPLRRSWFVLLPASGPRRPAVQAFAEFLRSDLARLAIRDGALGGGAVAVKP